MYDAFLKLIYPDGRQLRGASLDPYHVGWIDLESVSIAAPAPGTHDLPANDTTLGTSATMVKLADMTTAPLVLACGAGQEFGAAVLEIVRGGPDAQRITCRFEGVTVASVLPVDWPAADGLPREQLQIDYRKAGFSRGPAGIARLVGGGPAAAAAVLRAATGR